MLSPIAFTSALFESLIYPKEIYEIFIQSLVSFSDQVLSFAYKKVAYWVKPISTTLPEDFWIIHCILSNPLKTLSLFPFHPPDFTPGLQYTLEYKLAINVNWDQFLWPEEEKLAHHLIKLQEFTFVWTEDEKGKFSLDYFDLVVIPTVEHIPWSLKNILILPGIFSYIVEIIKSKIAAGVYKLSNSFYRSHWSCVLKKDGKSLYLMHDLQPLNTVIKDVGLPPMIEQYAKSFRAQGCYGIFDLIVRFDQCALAQ